MSRHSVDRFFFFRCCFVSFSLVRKKSIITSSLLFIVDLSDKIHLSFACSVSGYFFFFSHLMLSYPICEIKAGRRKILLYIYILFCSVFARCCYPALCRWEIYWPTEKQITTMITLELLRRIRRGPKVEKQIRTKKIARKSVLFFIDSESQGWIKRSSPQRETP